MIRRAGIRHQRAPDVHGQPGPLWPPTRLPGCLAWYDMLETFDNQAGVAASVRNMVTGSDAMAEATNRPAIEAAGINGRPCLKPDGSNDQLISTEASVVAGFIGANRPLTVVIVCQPDPATTQSAAIFAAANSAVANNQTHLYIRQTATNNWRMRRTDDAGLQRNVARNDPVSFTPQVVSFCTDGTHARIYVNQERTPSPSVGPTPTSFIGTGTITPDRIALFSRPDSSPDSFSADRWGALLVFDNDLYLPNLRGVIAALMGRWGIQ